MLPIYIDTRIRRVYNEHMVPFTVRLREAMQRRNLTQAKLAAAVGVTQPTVHAWLKGSEPHRPLYERLLAIMPELLEAA